MSIQIFVTSHDPGARIPTGSRVEGYAEVKIRKAEQKGEVVGVPLVWYGR